MFKRLLTSLGRFRRDEGGNAALIFALAALPLFALAGGAVDYTRKQEASSRLQVALDAATLAATKANTNDEQELREIVARYLRGNYRNDGILAFDPENDLTLKIEKDGHRTILRTQIKARYKPLFLSLILPGNEQDASVSAEARKGTSGFEIALVLDNTGSMLGNKMEELKQAARSMISSIAEASRDADLLRAHVGIVPYNVYVNVGTDKLGKDWLDTGNLGWWTWTWKGVVGMRSEPRDVLDGEYDEEGIPAVLNYFWYVDGGYWMKPSACTLWTRFGCMAWEEAVVPEIQPLLDITDEDNEQTLVNAVDAMVPFSGTNIPLGLVWGWRLLTPQEPYPEAMDLQEARAKNVRKVIVLMTDGWNTCFSEGLNGYVSCRGGSGTTAPEADERLRQLCTNIKNEGIGIVTVGYDVPEDSPAEELLKECQNLGYYRSDVGELVDTFEQIADDITRLHLSG